MIKKPKWVQLPHNNIKPRGTKVCDNKATGNISRQS